MRSSTLATLVALICLAAWPACAAAPSITSFAPAQGPINSLVTISGAAFTGATRVTFGGVTAVYRIASSTQVVAILPATVSGKVVVATPAGTATSSGTFTVTPGALAAPALVHPGANITVTASGMDPYTSMDVYFDTTDVALVASNGSGIASLTLALPASATPVKHWITFDERSGHKAVQTPVTINTDWLQAAYGPGNAGYNPFEGALNSATVPNLDTLWTRVIDIYGNAQPMVESKGTVFVANTAGIVRAYGPTGALVWTASPGGFVSNRSPVIYGPNVYFSNQTNVYAYAIACGTGGATCAPLWTTAVSSYGGGLTQYGGMLYVGGSDGNVYPINPATGALGTPFTAGGTADGGITTQVTFSDDGSYAYGVSDNLYVGYSNGSASLTFSGYVSALAFRGDLGYYETSDGMLHEFRGRSWTATLSGSGCVSTPAAAYGMVFAGDCNYVWGFNAANGAAYWDFAGGYVSGISVADHVVYACASNAIVALDAGSGTYLWTGGSCSSAPLVANGTVYSTDANIYAFTIPSLSPNVVRRAPPAGSLHRDAGLVAVVTPELFAAPR